MDTVIDLQDVSKRFMRRQRQLLAVQDLNFSVAPGEVLCLIGPSGCGKSTALNMIAGLTQPTGGRVLYRGEPIPAANRRLGYITQKDNLMPWRTVRGNVEFPLEMRKVPRAQRRRRVAEMLDLVGLAGFRESYPAELSGGMRKRVAFAQTLIYQPETILADEPFGALDAQLKLVMVDEFQRLQARTNATVVFVTHDLDEAITLGDRVAVFTGRPGQIKMICDIPFTRPRNVYRLRSAPGFGEIFERLWNALSEHLLEGEQM